MTFRRLRPKDPWQQLAAFVARSWAAFRSLKPKTQQRLLAAAGGLVLLLVIGIAVGVQSGGGPSEPNTLPTRAVAVPSEQPSEEPSQDPQPAATEPKAETYTYQGPKYEIVTVDENMGTAELSQYWVYTGKFDYPRDEYKVQVKRIIEDVARNQNTANLIVEVVTDKEIAEAEAASTYESFVEEHGQDYAMNTVPKKEKLGWVASYTGGFWFRIPDRQANP